MVRVVSLGIGIERGFGLGRSLCEGLLMRFRLDGVSLNLLIELI